MEHGLGCFCGGAITRPFRMPVTDSKTRPPIAASQNDDGSGTAGCTGLSSFRVFVFFRFLGLIGAR